MRQNDEYEEETIDLKANKGWDDIERIWNLIPIKPIQINIQRGQVVNKKFLYRNMTEKTIAYKFETNMPNILQFHQQSMCLSQEESMYVRIKFNTPASSCKMLVKMAFIALDDNKAKEGIEFNLIVAFQGTKN